MMGTQVCEVRKAEGTGRAKILRQRAEAGGQGGRREPQQPLGAFPR